MYSMTTMNILSMYKPSNIFSLLFASGKENSHKNTNNQESHAD